jgi:hypothetical protein
MVVKRNTRNKGNTHRKPVVPRVQPLLKCAPSYRVRTQGCTTSALRHTERSLQLDSSQHDRITERVIHQQQPESQELLPVAALALRPTPAEGLASYSCEAGLSQGNPHIARYHTTTCQQLPTPQREALHHAAQPLSTGWARTHEPSPASQSGSCVTLSQRVQVESSHPPPPSLARRPQHCNVNDATLHMTVLMHQGRGATRAVRGLARWGRSGWDCG